MTKMLIDRSVVEQVMETLERIDQADNDCDFLNPSQCYQLDEAMIALRTALEVSHEVTSAKAEQDRYQAFIDTLPDHLDDKMFEQIDLWARQTYNRHRSQVRGQMFDSGDSHQTHLIYAAFRWAKEHGNPLNAAPETPQPAKREPLTDAELQNALRQCPHDTVENLKVRWLYAKDFARAIERAHGIGE